MQLRTWGDGYGYVLVATGRVEAMYDPIAELYDLAPMPVILAEAGGRFSGLDGDERPRRRQRAGHERPPPRRSAPAPRLTGRSGLAARLAPSVTRPAGNQGTVSNDHHVVPATVCSLARSRRLRQRLAAGVLVVLATLALTPDVASADPAEPTNYRSEVTGVAAARCPPA